MPFTPQDEPHLLRALTLAQQALALASPNPTVGCVLTRNNTPIAEGAHLYDHRDHAEIAALKQAALNPTSFAFGGSRGLQAPESDSPKEGALAPEAAPTTAYVTLEPCAHHGRTGPCADALIAAGITRCVIATLDPNPLVRGNGLAKLRAAHMDTVLLDPTHHPPPPAPPPPRTGSPAPPPAPTPNSSATPPTPSSPASAPSSPTTPPSPTALASPAAAHCSASSSTPTSAPPSPAPSSKPPPTTSSSSAPKPPPPNERPPSPPPAPKSFASTRNPKPQTPNRYPKPRSTSTLSSRRSTPATSSTSS